ncbi:MAG: hypothetical protein ACSHW1_06455 [Yoonia sp.]|uniref:hypothetical protein n=1 Tax=Yoonia sp. TaxID=2212373 RepID=UPI003EF68B27
MLINQVSRKYVDDTQPEPEKSPSTLVVGDIARWTEDGRDTGSFGHFHFVKIQDLSEDTLAALLPEVILSPLIADGFDVLDLAVHLRRLGFRGRYRAIATNIPNPAMIRAEVRELAPELDFDLLDIDQKR